MTRLFAIGMLTVLGLGTSRVAAEEEDFYEVPQGKEPDHLVPVPRSREKSRLYTSSSFMAMPQAGPVAKYEVEPSFAPPYCVTLWEANDGTGFWIVVTSTVKMGEHRTVEAEVAAAGKAETAPVLEEKRAISNPLAVAIQRAWVRGLMKTRYPEHLSGGLDGANYYFSVGVRQIGMMEGQSWSPRKGTLPAEMVQLGEAICELATHPEQKEEPLIARMKAFEKKLAEKK